MFTLLNMFKEFWWCLSKGHSLVSLNLLYIVYNCLFVYLRVE